jgi:hypothetical protein
MTQMQFLFPWFFLLGFGILAVILFYFFRKQYEEKVISSNFLWEQVLNEWQASPWLKKLQQNLLFWLQILALLLLMFALVRPFWTEKELQGEQMIWIVDTSATMSAKYENTTRFEGAKAELLELANRLSGQEVTLIQAGAKPEILLNKETDKTAVRKAISSLALTYEHEEMEKAIKLALSLSSEKDTAIHIFSDSVDKEMVAVVEDPYLEVHNIGSMIDNLSMVSFGVGNFNGNVKGVAVLENQAKESKELLFQVHSEKELLFEETVAVEAGGQSVVQMPNLPKKPYYEATIQTEDPYLVDNQLSSILTETQPQIYMIGEVNPFAVKGFQVIGAEVLQTNQVDESMNGIFMAEASTLKEWPKQPLILFHSSSEKQPLTEPLAAGENELLQYVDYEKVYVASASKPLAGDYETVLKSGSVPLIQKGTQDGWPIILVNFSLADSDWPLQPSFPIFLYNSYQWLSQQTNFLGYYAPGEEKWLNVSEDSASWAIYDRNDENLYSLNLQKESFKAPFLPGTYQAVADDQINYFSVLMDEREKQVQVAPSFKMNERSMEEKSERQGRNDQLWFYLALVALLIVAIEWEVYRRGFRG